jgi:hypothetical protein
MHRSAKRRAAGEHYRLARRKACITVRDWTTTGPTALGDSQRRATASTLRAVDWFAAGE